MHKFNDGRFSFYKEPTPLICNKYSPTCKFFSRFYTNSIILVIKTIETIKCLRVFIKKYNWECDSSRCKQAHYSMDLSAKYTLELKLLETVQLHKCACCSQYSPHLDNFMLCSKFLKNFLELEVSLYYLSNNCTSLFLHTFRFDVYINKIQTW